MEASNFELDAYCQRIDTSLETLHAQNTPFAKLQHLMWQQISRIPFENTHVQNGETVSLAPEDIVNKIINNKRGGYCYELNGLLSMALSSLSIEHHYVACRPLVYDVLRPKTHMAIIATIDKADYLIDCAFGSLGPRQPIPLNDINTEIRQGPDRYRISSDCKHEFILSTHNGNHWQSQYGFDNHKCLFVEFEPANYFNANSPTTLFSQNLLAIIFTDTGRKVLFNTSFKEVCNHKETQRILKINEINSILETEFNLPANSFKGQIAS